MKTEYEIEFWGAIAKQWFRWPGIGYTLKQVKARARRVKGKLRIVKVTREVVR